SASTAKLPRRFTLLPLTSDHPTAKSLRPGSVPGKFSSESYRTSTNGSILCGRNRPPNKSPKHLETYSTCWIMLRRVCSSHSTLHPLISTILPRLTEWRHGSITSISSPCSNFSHSVPCHHGSTY